MSRSYPPRLASALMRWMGPRDEALVGDLLEAYQNGRSGWWYWRQVLASIAIGAGMTVRSHKLLAVRAIALGWAVWVLYVYYLALTVLVAARAVFTFAETRFLADLVDWFYVHHFDFAVTFVRIGPGLVSAWLGTFASGWLVGRFHRAQGATMPLVFFATLLLLPLLGETLRRIVFYGDLPPLGLATAVVYMFPLFLPALAGGLWAVRPRDRAVSIEPESAAGA